MCTENLTARCLVGGCWELLRLIVDLEVGKVEYRPWRRHRISINGLIQMQAKRQPKLVAMNNSSFCLAGGQTLTKPRLDGSTQ